MHIGIGGISLIMMTSLFAANPSGGTYMLKSYEIGGGGGSGSSSSYNLNGVTGTQNGNPAGSTTYGVQSGEKATADTNVPPAPALTNPSSYYDRLRLVLNTGNSPTDTKFAIAISPDNFATTTQYVKSDNSLGATQVLAD
ncbi:MAG TPA: hypothetical protein VF598_13195, partial [Hymenobacter sp.]